MKPLELWRRDYMTIKKLDDLGQEIFDKRYAYPGEKGWGDRCKVIARTIASCEKDDDKERVERKFLDVLNPGDFIPGGRIIYGSGRGGNLLNCYVVIPEDNTESIGKTIKDMYKISCAGGGIGFNFSKIRPKGDDIQNIPNSAPGSVSVMKMINEIGEHVRAGKNRRTALMSILNVTHPDLLEFLSVKLDKKELNNFNISVAITNRFIDAVESDDEWFFTFNNKKYYQYWVYAQDYSIQVIATSEEDAINRANTHLKVTWDQEFVAAEKDVVKARDIWVQLWENAVRSGDPGIFNYDLANDHTNVSYFEDLMSTNPCGEISLPSYGNCCLGHINLSNMVEDGEVNWKRLAKSVRAGIHFLDNVLTVNKFPTDDCQDIGLQSRRIGLGVTGLHYMLIKLGIVYGSEKCLEFLERLFATIRDEAYKQSIYLARDKAPFPMFNYKKYLQENFARSLPARIRMLIKQHGIRNAVMLTIAPTGTISMVHGVSSGIEPIFSAMYRRRFRDNNVWKETLVMDPLFSELKDNEDTKLDIFKGAYDINPLDHIKVQATVQKYIDQCISKTINLPEGTKVDKVSNIALDYVPYLKGLTIYQAGSKGEEPLQAIPIEEYQIGVDPAKGDSKQVIVNVATGEVCNLGGECGA